MGLLIILIIVVILALLALCFREHIFTSDTGAEGSLLVTGQGKDLYYVYTLKDNQKIDFTSTGNTMALPAGEYQVTLHNSGPDISVKGNETAVLETGVLLVEGQGLNLYEVWNEERTKKLNYTSTGKGFEFFPGTYTVILNNIPRKITVHARDTTLIATGRVSVTGNPDDLYYVFDRTGENQLQFTSVGKETELLSGKYIIQVNEEEKQVEITAGQVKKIKF